MLSGNLSVFRELAAALDKHEARADALQEVGMEAAIQARQPEAGERRAGPWATQARGPLHPIDDADGEPKLYEADLAGCIGGLRSTLHITHARTCVALRCQFLLSRVRQRRGAIRL